MVYTIQAINMILWIDQRSIARSRQIMEPLGGMEKCRVGDELLSLLSNAQLDDVLRWECVRALGQIGEKRAVPNLLGILLDAQADEEIRECAAESIGYLEDTSILPQLFVLLCDEAIATNIRKSIVHSIGKLGEHTVVDPLLSLIADEGLHPDVRCSIISVVEDIQEHEIVENMESLIPKLEQILEMEHLDPVVRQYADRTLSSLKAAVSSHNVQSSQNQAYSKKEKTNYTVSDERKFTVAKAEIVELVQSLRKTDTSCFTKLRGYPKDHQGYALESKIERANDIYYKLWEMSQQIGMRIFVVNTSAGSEVKLTKWGTLEE